MKHHTKFDNVIDTIATGLRWGVSVESFHRHLRKARREREFKKRVEYLDIAREKYERARVIFKRYQNPKKDPKLLSKLRKELDRAELCGLISPLSYIKL